MRILITDGMDKAAMAQLRELGHEVVEQFYEPDQLGAALRDFDAVVVRSKTKVRANHIDEAKGGKLKLIIPRRRRRTELLSGLSPRLPLKSSDFSWLLLTRPKFDGASPQTGDALLCYIFPRRQALRNRGGSCIIFLSKFCFLPDENGKLIRLIYRG